MQKFQSTDREGLPIGEPNVRRSSWVDLQRHASQPASATVLDEVDLELPFGIEACWRYTVGVDDAKFASWFAEDRAGMPVEVEDRVGGELVRRSVVYSDEVPPTA